MVERASGVASITSWPAAPWNVHIEKSRGQRGVGIVENLVAAGGGLSDMVRESIEAIRPSSIRMTGWSTRLVPFQSFSAVSTVRISKDYRMAVRPAFFSTDSSLLSG
jgi:hypothetical protein